MDEVDDIPEFPEADDTARRIREVEILQEAIGRAPIRSLVRIVRDRAFSVPEREGMFWSNFADGLTGAERLIELIAKDAATPALVDLCARLESEPWIALSFHIRATAASMGSSRRDFAAPLIGFAETLEEQIRGVSQVLGAMRATAEEG